MKYQLDIRANEGYGADQVRYTITVGELREMLDGLEDSDEVVTHDSNNPRGASFGSISRYLTEAVDDEEDEENE